MTEVTKFPLIYCLFMSSCFELEHGKVKLLTNELKTIEFNCPDFCFCYHAPKDNFSPKQTGFSIVCGTVAKENYPEYIEFSGHHKKVEINTIVFESSPEEIPMWILDFVLPMSVVYIGVPPVKYDMAYRVVPIEAGPRAKYLTLYGMQEVDINVHEKYESIHIEKCELFPFIADDSEKFNEALYITTHFPFLSSLTIKSSFFHTIIPEKEGFFQNAPLRMIDFSNNALASIDAMIYKCKHLLVTQIYLNNNRLTILPKKLVDSYPNLKILHLYGNNFRYLSLDSIQPLLKINEFLLYGFDSKNELVYNEENKNWVLRIEYENKNSVGLVESFLHHVIFKCSDNTHRIGQELRSLSVPECPTWKIRPENSGEHFTLAGQRKVLYGKAEDFSRNENERFGVNTFRKEFKDNHEVVTLSFDRWPIAKSEIILITNLRNSMLRYNDKFFIFSVTNHDDPFINDEDREKRKEWSDGIIEAIKEIPSVIGFEPVYLEGRKYCKNFKFNGNDCPLALQEYQKLFEATKVYIDFVRRMEVLESSQSWKYIFFLQFEIECLPLLKLLFSNELLETCNAMLSVKDATPLRIDAIDVMLKSEEHKSYEEQLRELREYKKNNAFRGKPIILTFSLGEMANHNMFDEISENHIESALWLR